MYAFEEQGRHRVLQILKTGAIKFSFLQHFEVYIHMQT